MSTLADRLHRMKEQFRKTAPPEALAVMDAATDALRNSGIMDRVPQVGSALPAFELEDTSGNRIASADLLQKGPLILSFYRGVW